MSVCVVCRNPVKEKLVKKERIRVNKNIVVLELPVCSKKCRDADLRCGKCAEVIKPHPFVDLYSKAHNLLFHIECLTKGRIHVKCHQCGKEQILTDRVLFMLPNYFFCDEECEEKHVAAITPSCGKGGMKTKLKHAQKYDLKARRKLDIPPGISESRRKLLEAYNNMPDTEIKPKQKKHMIEMNVPDYFLELSDLLGVQTNLKEWDNFTKWHSVWECADRKNWNMFLSISVDSETIKGVTKQETVVLMNNFLDKVPEGYAKSVSINDKTIEIKAETLDKCIDIIRQLLPFKRPDVAKDLPLMIENIKKSPITPAPRKRKDFEKEMLSNIVMTVAIPSYFTYMKELIGIQTLLKEWDNFTNWNSVWECVDRKDWSMFDSISVNCEGAKQETSIVMKKFVETIPKSYEQYVRIGAKDMTITAETIEQCLYIIRELLLFKKNGTYDDPPTIKGVAFNQQVLLDDIKSWLK